jgi:hypothetical protein
MHPAARVAKEMRSQRSHHIISVGIDKIRNIVRQRLGKPLAHHNSGTKFDGLAYERVTVHLRTTHSHKDSTLLDETTVNLDTCHITVNIAHHLLRLAIPYQLL